MVLFGLDTRPAVAGFTLFDNMSLRGRAVRASFIAVTACAVVLSVATSELLVGAANKPTIENEGQLQAALSRANADAIQAHADARQRATELLLQSGPLGAAGAVTAEMEDEKWKES